MKANKKYISIIALMAFSLMGLVAIQVYWIRSIIVEKTVEFESNIRRSMFRMSRRIEAEDMEMMMARYSGFTTNAIPNIKKDVNFVYMNSNPATGESISLIQSLFKEETLKIPINPNDASSVGDSLLVRNFLEYSKVLKNSPKSESIDGNTKYSISYGNTSSDNMVLNHVRTQISRIGEQLPIQQRLAPEKLINIIDEVLDENNINTSYQYAVLTNGELSSLHSTAYDDDLTPYHAALFVSEDGMAKYELVLRFPHEMGFVVRSIVPMILATMAFLIIIIAVFSMAIYYMVKQKRIADMKNDFINNMTHEFKTPIATINIATDALRTERVKSDTEKTEHFISVIKEENRRMLTQVESVLRIARLERGQMELNRNPSDLNSLLEEALEHIELIVSDREGTIDERFDADASTANVDKMHIINIFLNILDNANKYSPERPEITVRTYNPEENVWAVDISDKGMGMSHTEEKKIFDTFYRIPTGDIHNIKGHGLGLAYSKKIVEMHSGSISVRSTAGKGSTFTIKIPLDNSEKNK